MKAVVWSKLNCPHCVEAIAILKHKGYEVEERKVGVNFTKEQLLESVPTARSVPQIIIDGVYIGGCDNLKKHLDI